MFWLRNWLNCLCYISPPTPFCVCMYFDCLSIGQGYYNVMFDREHGKIIPFSLQDDFEICCFLLMVWPHTDGLTDCSTASGLRPCLINSVSRFHRQRTFITVASSLLDGLTGERVHCDSMLVGMATSAYDFYTSDAGRIFSIRASASV